MPIRILLFIVATTFLSSAETLFRLPVKSEADSAVTAVFSAALDSTFVHQFSIVSVPNENAIHPDSSICSAELIRRDSATYLFSFDLFLQGRADIAASLRLSRDSLRFDQVFFAIRRALLATDYNRLTLARLQIVGTDGALVSVNQEVSGRIPLETFVPSGRYLVDVSGPQLIRREFPLTLFAGRDTVIVADLITPSRMVSFGAGGAGLLCAIAAVLLNQMQFDRFDHYMQTRDASQCEALYTDYKNAVISRNICWTVASVFLLGGVAVYFDIPFPSKVSLTGR